MATDADTIVAVASAAGHAAIGVVRLSGPEARDIAETITAQKLAARQAHYATINTVDGVPLDKGVVLFFQAPHSYTGEDVVEFQMHGSPVLLQALTETCVKSGARHARPGEFTERAFHHNKLDLLQAEAVADLINSRSIAAARSANQSLQGRFSTYVDALLQEMTELSVFVEGALDFPEEEVDWLQDQGIENKLQTCAASMQQLLQRCQQGKRLNIIPKVVITGAPNVGKSSLLNCLTGQASAIVNERSGTTRDLIEQEVVLNDLAFVLVDSAGIRDSADPIEQEGVQRAQQAASSADIVIHMFVDGEVASETIASNEDNTAILVFNKIDQSGSDAGVKPGPTPTVYLSAKTGAGIDGLIQVLQKLAGARETDETPLLARQRHIDAIQQAQAYLANGLDTLQSNRSVELLAEDLRLARKSLAALKGEQLPDDLLGEIFSRFCIGK